MWGQLGHGYQIWSGHALWPSHNQKLILQIELLTWANTWEEYSIQHYLQQTAINQNVLSIRLNKLYCMNRTKDCIAPKKSEEKWSGDARKHTRVTILRKKVKVLNSVHIRHKVVKQVPTLITAGESYQLGAGKFLHFIMSTLFQFLAHAKFLAHACYRKKPKVTNQILSNW